MMLWIVFLFAVMTLASASLFDFKVLNAENIEVDLAQYRSAKVILVVNVATNCGYTHTNYRELRELYTKYHEKGLEILAFPCNQFGEQEPAPNYEIQSFVKSKYVDFPVFAKIDVNGPTAAPLFKYLKQDSDNKEIPWNFAKFLLVDGVPVKRFHSRVSPKHIEQDIIAILDGNAEL